MQSSRQGHEGRGRSGPPGFVAFLFLSGIGVQGMNRGTAWFFVASLLLGMGAQADAHSVHYRVENKGVAVRVFYAEDAPASYSAFEIFGPGSKIAHQKGRTDKNGFVAFVPDCPGTWRVTVLGESEHGMHAASIEIEVNESLFMDSFRKPLVARYTKAFVGMSTLFGLFGVWAFLRSWSLAPKAKEASGSKEPGKTRS